MKRFYRGLLVFLLLLVCTPCFAEETREITLSELNQLKMSLITADEQLSQSKIILEEQKQELETLNSQLETALDSLKTLKKDIRKDNIITTFKFIGIAVICGLGGFFVGYTLSK